MGQPNTDDSTKSVTERLLESGKKRRGFVSIGKRFGLAVILVVMITLLAFDAVGIYLNVSRSFERLDQRLNRTISLAQTKLGAAIVEF